MTLAKVLPLAFVMIAGPQILSAIFLATSEKWRSNSAAYVAGAALSITTVVTLAFLLSTGASNHGASGDTLDIIFMVPVRGLDMSRHRGVAGSRAAR